MSVAHHLKDEHELGVEAVPDADRRIRCRSCGAEITSADLALQPGGCHEHTFRNPAGYSWRVACFRRAAGCRSVGDLTADASWFAGYSWCYAPCASCGTHLGWWFVGSAPSFAALITTRLLL